MKKKLFGEGLFIVHDKDGAPIYIGDHVKATRGAMEFEKYDQEWGPQTVEIEEETWTGVMVLLKSKGVALRVGKSYIFPKLTNRGHATWTLEKLRKIKS